jgi:ABC-type transport system involved in multi-copper enzyme maturation permease subunit
VREEAILEFRKTAARKSLLLLLGLATLLTVLLHLSMRAEANYLLRGPAETREILDRGLQAGSLTEPEYQDRIASVDEAAATAVFEEKALLFPDSLRMGMQTLATAGALFVAMGAALSFGSEHSWGTYRNLVSVGRPRARVLVAQFLGYLLLALAALVVTLVIAAGLGLLESLALAQPTPRFSADWTALGITAAGTALVLVFWAGVGMVAAVLGRSPGAAVSIATLVWVATLFTGFLGPAIRRWNVDSLTASLLSYGDAGRIVHGLFVPAGLTPRASAPAPGLAALILGGLIGAILVVATRRFQHMDIL